MVSASPGGILGPNSAGALCASMSRHGGSIRVGDTMGLVDYRIQWGRDVMEKPFTGTLPADQPVGLQ